MKTKIEFILICTILFAILFRNSNSWGGSGKGSYIAATSYKTSPVISSYYDSKERIYVDIEKYIKNNLKIPITECGIGILGYSNTGIGVIGVSQKFDGVLGIGKAYGVYGKSTNRDGYGVFGYSKNGHGVVGKSNVKNKSGVYGVNSNFLGYGVFARNTAGGFAMLSIGDMYVNGCVYADNIPRNFAKQALVTCSSDFNNTAGNIKDGIMNRKFGVWHSDLSVNATPCIVLKWEKPQKISGINIYNITNYQSPVSKVLVIINYDPSTGKSLLHLPFDMPLYEYAPLKICLTSEEGTDIKTIVVKITGVRTNSKYTSTIGSLLGPGLAEIECYYNAQWPPKFKIIEPQL